MQSGDLSALPNDHPLVPLVLQIRYPDGCEDEQDHLENPGRPRQLLVISVATAVLEAEVAATDVDSVENAQTTCNALHLDKEAQVDQDVLVEEVEDDYERADARHNQRDSIFSQHVALLSGF